MPDNLKHIHITEDDETMFIEWTSQGLHKDKLNSNYFNDGFNALKEGKRYAGIRMKMYEDGILDGSVPYWGLLGGEDPSQIPSQFVVDFMKKELFEGIDADLIDRIFEAITEER